MKMKAELIFLGTGTSQGVPVIGCKCAVCRSVDARDKRFRSSVYLDFPDAKILIDTGPDFRMQMLRERISRIDAVLFTHQHKDHTAGMDELRSFNFLQNEAIPIYGRPSVIEQLKIEFAYIFANFKYPGIADLSAHHITGDTFFVKNIPVTPVEVMHYKLAVYGFRFGDLTYITDANFISESEKDKIRGCKTLIINALNHNKHISHFSLPEALEVIADVQPEKAYLTHISHNLGKHRLVQKENLPPNVFLAYDGLRLPLEI
jgi:phosphoribosyl 1,2-cyclic phosphate phosphodiesterase